MHSILDHFPCGCSKKSTWSQNFLFVPWKRGDEICECASFSRRSEQALNSASEPVNSPCTVLWFTLLQPVARGYRVRWKVFFFSLYARCWRRSDDCITGISSCVFIPAADSNCGLFTRGQLIFGTDIHLPWKSNSLNNQCWKYNILKYCSSSPPHIFDTCTYFADSDDSVFIGYQLLSDIVKVAWLK